MPMRYPTKSYDANADILLQQLGWRELESQRQSQKATMVYKSLNDLAPDYLRTKFTNRSSVTTYSLRDTESKLAIPLPRTNFIFIFIF